MIDECNAAIESYKQKWEQLIAETTDKDFFASLVPTAIGWKAEDLADYDRIYAELRGQCDQIHTAWINGRWLATMHLRDAKLACNISVIKLMQRRPGSTDAIGLDHIDFFTRQSIQPVVEKEPQLKWTLETNNPLCSWISVWFDNTEAKLRDSLVFDVCIAELEQTKEHIIDSIA